MALLTNTPSESVRQLAIALGGVLLMYAGATETEPLSSFALWMIGALFVLVGAFWRWG